MTTELTTYKPQEITISDLRNMATDFAKSGYFQDARDMAQAVVKIQAGRELGFGPVYSMTKIYIVKGKIAVSAETLGAMVKRSGRYDYAVRKLDDEECILFFTDNGKEAYTSKFTMTDARRAGLVAGGSGWEKWPRAMLMSKALSQGARIVCPHVIAGVYTPEDMGMEATTEGEYQQPTVIVSEAPLPELPAPAVEMCTSKQRQRIFATGKQMGYSEDDLRKVISGRYKKEHTTELTTTEANEFIESLEQGKHINDAGEWI